MEKNNITMCIMMPSVGQYSLKPIEVKIEQMKKFLLQNFADNEPKEIQYYYTIHDELRDLLG